MLKSRLLPLILDDRCVIIFLMLLYKIILQCIADAGIQVLRRNNDG